ncbi:MAG: DEAD/DEAH box helicase family protein [Lachnospiraceae bacterium]|nr:DEAD/DEAH box helicase family protein [Lachnospiraceae bacterium]
MIDLLASENTGEIGRAYTSAEIQNMLETLVGAKKVATRREKDELARLKKEAEKKKEQEERERRENHIAEVTSMDLPLDWENVFFGDERTQGVHVDSIPDALVMSLTTIGSVDIEYMSSITGEDYKTVISALKGSIYQNPETWGECFYKGWETAEEYLSGNLMRKWKAATKANEEYNGYFADNLKAIEKVLPPAVASKDIYITLGSPWVPAEVIDEFIEHLFGESRYFGNMNAERKRNLLGTCHDEITGTWEIPYKNRYWHSVGVSKTYGTDRIEALQILENTLNMKAVKVTDEQKSLVNKSGVKRVLNRKETVAALEKQKEMIKAFQDWVWTDPARKEKLEMIFENNFSCVRRRIFDGSFLTFPTMAPGVTLYPYQKDAVARIIFTPNTLLAHDVGAGKTYVMIASGQELRRMGLSKKNMYVVPNNLVGQWKSIFALMYPDAKVLCIEPKTFKPDKREGILERVRDDDFDGIIIAYSCFEQIPLSRQCYLEDLKGQQMEVSQLIRTKGKATSKLSKKAEKLAEEINKLESAWLDVYDTVCFDELGITRLFVDEAHNFKNVPVETKTTNVLGISTANSKKCRDMLDKVHLIQRRNGGKGVVMATGTPITNSITDAFVMQMYLQSGELALLDLQSFDSWIGMFAERVTEFEIDVDTSSYRLATRFSRFHNLPELTAMLSSFADFHAVDGSADIPLHDGYNDALIGKTREFASYLLLIADRADQVRSGMVSRRDDNMLKITTDGRKAALDLRLIDPSYAFSYQSKVARCAENVADIYLKTSKDMSTQLVFCDSSTPKKGFNLYTELKERLMLLNIPEDQIAFIHDADTEARRSALFRKMRKGEIRILIGSTFKLGLGVNIQDKLIALHHLDVPWRPADMTQREGRILRQGNENKKVYIYRYITEGSFDAYSWQLLETKQRFISSLLSGVLTERSGADIDDTVLDYAEVKALAVGNPLVKERVEASNELMRYRVLQHKLAESRVQMEKELLEIPHKVRYQKELIAKCEDDIEFCTEWRELNPVVSENKMKKADRERRKDLREAIGAALKDNILQTSETHFFSYRGFDIVLPAGMTAGKPYVWLVRSGKYYVELGDTDVGNLIRIDNALDTLPDRLETLKKGLADLGIRAEDIRAELNKDESYADEIAFYKNKIKEIDEQLGVKKNG